MQRTRCRCESAHDAVHGSVPQSLLTPLPASILYFCREAFFEAVGALADDEDAMAQMHAFCTAFSAVLAEVQAFLAENGLDDPAKV